MVKDHSVREENCCCHIVYSFRLAARVLLYPPSHRQDSTYHSLCYTNRGALAGLRNSSMGSPWRMIVKGTLLSILYWGERLNHWLEHLMGIYNGWLWKEGRKALYTVLGWKTESLTGASDGYLQWWAMEGRKEGSLYRTGVKDWITDWSIWWVFTMVGYGRKEGSLYRTGVKDWSTGWSIWWVFTMVGYGRKEGRLPIPYWGERLKHWLEHLMGIYNGGLWKEGRKAPYTVLGWKTEALAGASDGYLQWWAMEGRKAPYTVLGWKTEALAGASDGYLQWWAMEGRKAPYTVLGWKTEALAGASDGYLQWWAMEGRKEGRKAPYTILGWKTEALTGASDGYLQWWAMEGRKALYTVLGWSTGWSIWWVFTMAGYGRKEGSLYHTGVKDWSTDWSIWWVFTMVGYRCIITISYRSEM